MREFLDKLVDSSFKRFNNHWEFYPISLTSKYYLIDNNEQYFRIRRFVKQFLLLTLLCIILAVSLHIALHETSWQFVVLLLPFLPLFFIYNLRIKKLTRHLKRTSKHLTILKSILEGQRKTASTFPNLFLWRSLITNFIIVIGCIGLIIYQPTSWLISLAGIIFFGFLLFIGIHRLYLKYQVNSSEKGTASPGDSSQENTPEFK